MNYELELTIYLFPAPCSLFPAPYSLSYPLFPIPYSLDPDKPLTLSQFVDLTRQLRQIGVRI